MRESKGVRIALWAAVILSPLVSVLVISLVSGTSLFALDAWSTTWNDEQHYNLTVAQMRTVGYPSAVSGYNEAVTPFPSYGTYSVFVYLPYYLASLFTGVDSHNFIYVINMAFGVLSAVLVVVALRPDARQSLCFAALFGLQFVVGRYLCSGMTEADHVLFGAILGCLALWAAGIGGARRASQGKPRATWALVAAFVVMALAIGFWGEMRPYLLAFVAVPFLLVVFDGCGLAKPWRAALAVFMVAAMGAALALYFYTFENYMVPYFTTTSMSDTLAQRLADPVAGLVMPHVECVVYAAKSLVKLDWQGIMMLLFAVGFVMLVVLAVRARRARERRAFILILGLLLAGLAIFEANLLLYTVRQMHRTLIVLNFVYGMGIVMLAVPRAGKDEPAGRHAGNAKPRLVRSGLRAGYVVLTALVCAVALVVHPADFKLPQVPDGYDAAAEQAIVDELAQIMPQSGEPWDNTVAHPVESANMRIYFCMPVYTNLNCCQDGFLAKAMKKGTLSSKFVSLPDDDDLNEIAAKRYEVVYKGMGHVLYRTR